MIRFGTGGWRALIGEDFTKSNVQMLAEAVANILMEDGEAGRGILIGYDRRFLSKQACRWAAEVIAAKGVKCRVFNQDAPTPTIMFGVQHYRLNWGIAITASHNPSTYNGVKLFTTGGHDADETVTARVEQEIAKIQLHGFSTLYGRASFEDSITAGAFSIALHFLSLRHYMSGTRG